MSLLSLVLKVLKWKQLMHIPYHNNTTISPKNLEQDETFFVSSRANELSAYNLIAGPGLYHLQITDAASDGTCCLWGKGFMTVTNATDVLWGLTGSRFTTETNAYIWVNGDGSAERADYIPGLGYILVKGDKKKDGKTGSATIQLLLRETEVRDVTPRDITPWWP
jgi:hypothetical protein